MQRSEIREAILENRFIQKVLREEAQDIEKAQNKKMFSFTPETKSGRSFYIEGTTLTYLHRTVHRFIDMKTRQTKDGKIRKKNHAIHNRILFGHYNNIVHRLSYGFTDAVKAQMEKLDGEKL